MRPINLIPEDERRGAGGGGKAGPIAYILIGALLLVLAGVTLMVSTGNEISSSRSEIAELEAENATAQAKVTKLASYVQLQDIHDQRVDTVRELAESRFDWERVMRELALILPDDITLNSLSASTSPDVAVNSASGISLRSATPGPALEMVGCADGQEGVAGFVAALKDIDGVTRVAMQSSKLGEEGSENGASAESGGATESSSCSPNRFIAEFQIVIAFDAAPVTSEAAEGEATTTATEVPAESEAE
jgi:Tfp pilus assembly protein PilN